MMFLQAQRRLMKVKQVPQMQDGDSSHTMTINILVKEA